MTPKKTILKCILILCFQTIVHGNFKKEKLKPKIFRVVESKNQIFLRNDENDNYNPEALVSFLNKNADLEYKINNKQPKTNGLKRILIKRKIPHGLETPSSEYDHVHKTLYRPLVRYHKTKKNNHQNNDFLDYENNEKDLTFVGKNLVNNRHQHRSTQQNNRDFSKQLLLQPFYYNNYRKQNYLRTKDDDSHESRINSEPDDYYKSNRRLKKKPKLPAYPRTKRELTIELLKELNELTRSVKCKKLRRKIRAEVSEMLDELTQLRTGTVEPQIVEQEVKVKSGEKKDPSKLYHDLIHNKSKKKKKKSYMHAPFYHDTPLTNFWTYKKTIPTDDCPGQLIKIGNICAKAPPH